MKKIQFLFRSGVLSYSEATRSLHTSDCKLFEMPRCAACLYGKQTLHSAPRLRKTIVKDKAGVLKASDLLQVMPFLWIILSVPPRADCFSPEGRHIPRTCTVEAVPLWTMLLGISTLPSSPTSTVTKPFRLRNSLKRFVGIMVLCPSHLSQTMGAALLPKPLANTSPSSNRSSSLLELVLIITMVWLREALGLLWR